jgi:hypothetical protein
MLQPQGDDVITVTQLVLGSGSKNSPYRNNSFITCPFSAYLLKSFTQGSTGAGNGLSLVQTLAEIISVRLEKAVVLSYKHNLNETLNYTFSYFLAVTIALKNTLDAPL